MRDESATGLGLDLEWDPLDDVLEIDRTVHEDDGSVAGKMRPDYVGDVRWE